MWNHHLEKHVTIKTIGWKDHPNLQEVESILLVEGLVSLVAGGLTRGCVLHRPIKQQDLDHPHLQAFSAKNYQNHLNLDMFLKSLEGFWWIFALETLQALSSDLSSYPMSKRLCLLKTKYIRTNHIIHDGKNMTPWNVLLNFELQPSIYIQLRTSTQSANVMPPNSTNKILSGTVEVAAHWRTWPEAPVDLCRVDQNLWLGGILRWIPCLLQSEYRVFFRKRYVYRIDNICWFPSANVQWINEDFTGPLFCLNFRAEIAP